MWYSYLVSFQLCIHAEQYIMCLSVVTCNAVRNRTSITLDMKDSGTSDWQEIVVTWTNCFLSCLPAFKSNKRLIDLLQNQSFEPTGLFIDHSTLPMAIEFNDLPTTYAGSGLKGWTVTTVVIVADLEEKPISSPTQP